METAASSYAIHRAATSWKVLKMFSVNIMVPGAQTPKCHFVKVNNKSWTINLRLFFSTIPRQIRNNLQKFYEALFNVIFRRLREYEKTLYFEHPWEKVCSSTFWHLPNKRNMRNSSYRSYQRFNMETRPKGKFCFVLPLSPRLCAFLNK